MSNNKNDNYSIYSNSNSSSIYKDINFSALFNPNNKYINIGEKTCYNLLTYDLGIFASLSNIYKELNIPCDTAYTDYNSSLKIFDNGYNNNENNENTINISNNKDKNIITDSIIKILLSENDSGNKNDNQKESTTTKKLNLSGFSLNIEDIDELLKDYSPMEIDKKI